MDIVASEPTNGSAEKSTGKTGQKALETKNNKIQIWERFQMKVFILPEAILAISMVAALAILITRPMF